MTENNHKILVTEAYLPPREEYEAEIKDIWDTHWLTNMGSKHQQLAHQLEQYLDVPHIDLLINGHMALEMSMQAMNLSGEVITTPFTFASTTHAIVRNGLKPVFCDIIPDDFTIDTTKIESLITERTSAIVPVHVYGNICNVEEIQRIADKHHLKVLYDAAHAFGVTYQGKGIGSYGDVSCYSFHATKVFNSIEGGAAAYHNEEFGRKLYGLKNFGIRDAETVDAAGANAKMNEFCAAMGICNLRHVNECISSRKEAVIRYRSHLDHIEGIQLNPIQEGVVSNYAYFPIIVDPKVFGVTRDEIQKSLESINVFTRKYFYPLITDFECYRNQYDSHTVPVAERISQQVLTLPLYAGLSLEDVDRICVQILSLRK